jgi:hypothetical protein
MTEVANPPIPEVASVPEDVPNPRGAAAVDAAPTDRLADIEREIDALKKRVEDNLAKLNRRR